MLVLSRKEDQVIIIDGRIRVTVVEIRGSQVRLGIEAPPDIAVLRSELRGSGATPAITIPPCSAPEPLLA